MLGALLAGVIALVVFVFLARAFIAADPKTLATIVRYAGAGLLLIAAVVLALAGRFTLALLLAGAAWALAAGRSIWPFRRWSPGASGPSGGARSQVRSEWVEMELDHDSGAMTGRVLRGAHAGSTLESLSFEELLALRAEAEPEDPDGARLIEAYLDRVHGPAWRSRGETARGQERRSRARQRDAAMSVEEARRILGVEADAPDNAIRAAHRRMMKLNHPDRGGSDYLAAKINEAKDVLLGR